MAQPVSAGGDAKPRLAGSKVQVLRWGVGWEGERLWGEMHYQLGAETRNLLKSPLNNSPKQRRRLGKGWRMTRAPLPTSLLSLPVLGVFPLGWASHDPPALIREEKSQGRTLIGLFCYVSNFGPISAAKGLTLSHWPSLGQVATP